MLKKWLKKIKGKSSQKFSKSVDNFSENLSKANPKTGERLKGKIALISGAGKGIGRAIAKCFASEGAKILINSRTQKDLEILASEIKSDSGDCHIFAGDITNPEIVRNMFAELKSYYGAPNICVNSAGTAGFGFIQDFPIENFQKIMNLNVNAAYNFIQESVKLMEANGNQGKIITIGSIASRWTERGGSGAYTASKHAVYAMVESVARQLHGTGSNIAVSILCPGVVDTPLTNPNGDSKPDWLKPETIADSALHIVTAPTNANIFDVTVFGMKDKPW
tara:strand:- start:1439 stop:2272 length:834 start_codon:yes stop_codon:yes gene_type:complete